MSAKWRLAVLTIALAPALGAAQPPVAPPDPTGGPLPAWQEGELDIHHINTGRGEASFFIFPDGTNQLVDTS